MSEDEETSRIIGRIAVVLYATAMLVTLLVGIFRGFN